MKIIRIILFTFLFILTSCLEEAPRQVASSSQDQSSNGDTTTIPGEVIETVAKPTTWYDQGQEVKTIILEKANNKNYYIFGDSITDYLNLTTNYNSNFCIEFTFSPTASTTPLPLRAKLIPGENIDGQTGLKYKYFRINLISELGNDICNLPTQASETAPVVMAPISIAYKTSDVCTNCTNTLYATSIKLYKLSTPTSYPLGLLSEITSSASGFEELVFGINMNGESSGSQSSNTCSTNSCQAQGFDCCIQNQCVKEKAIIASGVTNDMAGFLQAESQKTDANGNPRPNWYIDYPQFYYSCLETPPNDDGGSDDPTDPVGDAEQRLADLVADYNCVEELKLYSIEDPFHIDPIDESLSPSPYSQCSIDPTPPLDNMYYEEVMKRLYTNCGCVEKDDLSQMIAQCPKYTYKLVYKKDLAGIDTNEIEDVVCKTPEVVTGPTPFQDLEVIVSSRTAPHRFFTSSNEEINMDSTDLGTLTSTDQEGVEFQYLDEEKIFPLNGSFNMNSILGQMTVSLDQARPAKIVDLEFDKYYYIAALEGIYSSCPSCAKDSWFANFSASPLTGQGLGIRAVGSTTTRDEWGTNQAFANYEDTIFGRACWLPPTMLPFAQTDSANSQTQRINRLQAQAAMYINGYQRDWYGFNKGALIGSFDGVTWFAIGKGRKVRATSDKLFLAINAPFADLALATNHKVSVQEYDFITTASNYDYNFSLEENDSEQNEAGLCQKYHECDTDAHCVSKLGWEYTCVDVSNYKTKWPTFDSSANEKANNSQIGSIVDFLANIELSPGNDTKRCVYRGAGSPCRIDLENVASEDKRRALSCAPNFYCASLTSSDFNDQVARYAAPLENIISSKNHYFGQDADILGRPLDYIKTTGGSSLPTNVQTAISENLTQTDSSIGANAGICRPGKSLPDYASVNTTQNANPINQAKQKDPFNRTDFISQIAGCNSSLYTNLKFSSCPSFDKDGNYIHLKTSFLNDVLPYGTTTITKATALKLYGTIQNSCGLENVDPLQSIGIGVNEEDIRQASAFKSIMARDLASSDVQVDKTLVQNACFRRAGSVCHTNLDCAPNKMHYEIIDIINPSIFGNEPEKKYWQEYLVCGQKSPEPILSIDGEEAFNSFNMENNRCCREIGKDITLYTEDSDAAPESAGIRSDLYGSFHPNNANRYSRYISSNPIVSNSLIPTDSNYPRPSASKNFAAVTNILKGEQWRTINTTAKRTCCGGNWVRKFADGTNDWTKNRLNFNLNNLRCINYETPLLLTDEPDKYYTTEDQLGHDQAYLCVDSTKDRSSCAQQTVASATNLLSTAPIPDSTVNHMILDNHPIMNGNYVTYPWAYTQLQAYDNIDGNYFNFTFATRAEIETEAKARQVLVSRLPTWVTFDETSFPVGSVGNVNNLLVEINNPALSGSIDDGVEHQCERVAFPGSGDYRDLAVGIASSFEPNNFRWQAPANACMAGGSREFGCCFAYDPSSRIFVAAYGNGVLNGEAPTYNWSYANRELRVKLSWTAPGTQKWETEKSTAVPFTDPTYDDNLPHRRSMKAGNELFYLKKLAKLEYVGIPQMTYEPIMCNDIYQKMVPGIFTEDIKTYKEFVTHSKTFVDTTMSPNDFMFNSASAPGGGAYSPIDNVRRVADQELVAHAPIFSDHDFKCCMPLNEKIGGNEDPSICCSGYAVADGDSSGEAFTQTCKLPAGADLNVYFNKFVSGEGVGDVNFTSSPLEDSDFDTKTGEPKLDTVVITKLRAIGNEVCESGATRLGGLAGNYAAQPIAPIIPVDSSDNAITPTPIYGLADSYTDEGAANNVNVGASVFDLGFRWNHHVYCEVGDGN